MTAPKKYCAWPVAGDLKPVHFVSTLSVFHVGQHDDGTIFREDDDLMTTGVPFGGYAQSKWVAEQLVLTARARGLPVTIYRPGLISGASDTGAWNDGDMMSSMARICLLLGQAPDLDVTVDMAPVDYVSAAIVTLSQRPDSAGQIYHLANPAPLPFRSMLAQLSEMGVPIRPVAFEAWRDQLLSLAAAANDSDWRLFLPLIEDVTADQIFMPAIDCSHTVRDLAGSGISCPPVDQRLLRTYLSMLGVTPEAR